MKNGPVYKYMEGEEPPKDKPVQYLRGWVEFYKLKFKVTPDVLIPRPDTELLVEEVLAWSKSTMNQSPINQLTIIDLGTGSGNIAISIAKNLPKARIFATDISEEALEIARENAKKHRVEKRIFFLKSDLLEDVSRVSQVPQVPQELNNQNSRGTRGTLQSRGTPAVDIIVTNLPYIPTSRIPYLDPSVKDFEPKVALDGGSDGFELYRELFAQMKEKNIIPKLLIGEIDYTQGEIAVNEANKYFPEATTEVKTDLAHKQRILTIKF